MGAEAPASRAESGVVYIAGLVQGLALVTFPAAGTIFTDPDEYDLSKSAYGAMFVPQAIAAIAASLLGAAWARRAGARRVYLTGLLANLLAMALLIVSSFVEQDGSLAYGLLLVATASLGVGFGLTVPALNTFTAAFHPDAVDRSVLVLNALLGLGTALAPVFVAIFVGLGFWWGLPVLAAALVAGVLVVSLRLPLRTAASAPPSRTAAAPAPRGLPSRFWLYAAFALLYGVCETVNGNWAQLDMTGLGASTTAASLALTAFWAMVTVGRILFAARAAPLPRSPGLPPAAVRPGGRPRADLASARRRPGARGPGLRIGRPRLLGAPAAHHQPGAGRVDRHLGVGGGRGHRLLPARLRHRRIRRGPAGERRCRSVRRSSGSPPSSRRPWACCRSPSPGDGPSPPPSTRARPDAVRAPLDPRSTDMSLDGKVAIVTGGNSGIGKAVVLALAEQGANVVIDYISHPEATEEVERQVAALGDRAIGVKADVSKVADLKKLVRAAVKEFGRLDIMVNNAGIETRSGILDSTEKQFDMVIAINLKSAFFGTQLAAQQMVDQGDGGVIINISSVHEDWPMPGNTPYCLSKGGMRMLTRTAGVELAPHGVRVVGLGPGAVATPINLVEMDPKTLKKVEGYIPLGRMAQPEEIASVVAFLAGPGAVYMTGTTVFADGAIMMQSPGL